MQALQDQHHAHDHDHHDHDHDTTDPQLTHLHLPPPDPQVETNNAKDPFSVLSRIPVDIASVRERLFTLEEPVEFSAQDWDKYWP